MWTRGATNRRAAANSDAGDDLGRECEAYLDGRYVEWLDQEGLPVPAWARLNGAAHADLPTLRRRVTPPGSRRPRSWEEVEAVVTAAVVAATSEATLAGVQRAALIPLELELMRRTMSPRATLERVYRALY